MGGQSDNLEVFTGADGSMVTIAYCFGICLSRGNYYMGLEWGYLFTIAYEFIIWLINLVNKILKDLNVGVGTTLENMV